MYVFVSTGVVAASMLGFVLPPVLYLKAHEVEFRAAIATARSCRSYYSSADSLPRGSIGRGSTEGGGSDEGGGGGGKRRRIGMEESVWDGDSMSINDEQEPSSSDGASQHIHMMQMMQMSSYTTNPMMNAYDSLDPRRGSSSPSSHLDELDFELMSNDVKRRRRGRMMFEAMDVEDQIEEDSATAAAYDREDSVAAATSYAAVTTTTTSSTTSHSHGRGCYSSSDRNRWGAMSLQCSSSSCSSNSSSSSSPFSCRSCSSYSELFPFLLPIGMILFGFMSLLVGVTSVILDNS